MAKRKPGEKVKETDPRLIKFAAEEKARRKASAAKADKGTKERIKKRSEGISKKAAEARRSGDTHKKGKNKVGRKITPKKAESKGTKGNIMERLVAKRKKQIKSVTGQ